MSKICTHILNLIKISLRVWDVEYDVGRYTDKQLQPKKQINVPFKKVTV